MHQRLQATYIFMKRDCFQFCSAGKADIRRVDNKLVLPRRKSEWHREGIWIYFQDLCLNIIRGFGENKVSTVDTASRSNLHRTGAMNGISFY